jgi:hypothetical protein
MNPDRPLASHHAAEFGSALMRVLRGMSLITMAATLVAALVVAEILLLYPDLVRPVTGYLVTAALGVFSLAGAFWFRRNIRWLMTTALVTIVVCVTLNLVLLDGLLGSIFAVSGNPADTIYSEKYSEWRFWRVTKGTTREQVLQSLGEPLVECWVYPRHSGSINPQVVLEKDKVTDVEPGNDPRLMQVKASMTRADLFRVTGAPSEKVFSYTKGTDSHRTRMLRFRNDRVVEKVSYYYID